MVELFNVGKRTVCLACLELSFERLQVVMEVVFVCAHFRVDAADFAKVAFGLSRLIFHKFQIGSLSHNIPRSEIFSIS